MHARQYVVPQLLTSHDASEADSAIDVWLVVR